jgi:RimJ/RimL family protein N-acetyltransferase
MGRPAYLCEGKFVLLRQMTEGDAATIVHCRNQPEVARWLVQWAPLTLEQHLRWFRSHRHADALFVFDLPDRTPIGMGSLYGFDRLRTSAEWGRVCSFARTQYAFAMLEGCYLVHRLAFELLGMKRLHCAAAAGNASALRLGAWLGYSQEALRRQHLCTPDGYRDVFEFGLLSADFAEKRHVMEQFLYKNKPLPIWREPAAEFAASGRCP